MKITFTVTVEIDGDGQPEVVIAPGCQGEVLLESQVDETDLDEPEAHPTLMGFNKGPQ